jgi:hypothetical protein
MADPKSSEVEGAFHMTFRGSSELKAGGDTITPGDRSAAGQRGSLVLLLSALPCKFTNYF